MKNYEINRTTLAIVPINENKCMIYEENNNFIINLPVSKIIDDSCKFFGSSYDGRFEGTKNLLNISHKAPIVIEETNNIIFFPTISPRLETCSWISLNNLKNYYKNDNKSTIIKFYCGKQIIINIAYGIVDNQVLRATRLKYVIENRINYIKNV